MRIILAAILLSLVTPLLPLGPGAALAKDTRLVAQVGRVPVTEYELAREEDKLLPKANTFHGKLPAAKLAEIRTKALDTLIERAYMTQYALDAKIAVDKQEISQAYAAIRKNFKSDADLKKKLGKETADEFQAALQRELLARKALAQVVENRIRLTPQELRAAYDEKRAMYVRPKQFRASLIQINIDPASEKEQKEVLKKKAEDLAAKAKGGEDFYNLAYYNSDDRTRYVGGDIGYFFQGRLIPELDSKIQKMKVGAIEGPIRTDYGYTILKLTEVEEARQMTFAEVEGKIRKMIEDERRQPLFDSWMAGLRKKYPARRFNTPQQKPA